MGALCKSAVSETERKAIWEEKMINAVPEARYELFLQMGGPPTNMDPAFWKYAALHRLRHGVRDPQ